MTADDDGVVHAWRHPPPVGAAGRCIGRTDLGLDRRKAKRLAHRIERFARARRLPREVVTSPLERCRAVGRWLRRRGWRHRVDPLLLEFDFGAWDGRPWSAIPVHEIDAWCDAFATHAAGGGECVDALSRRVAAFDPGPARVLVGHAGWLCAALALERRDGPHPTAADWPAAPRYGARVELRPGRRA